MYESNKQQNDLRNSEYNGYDWYREGRTLTAICSLASVVGLILGISGNGDEWGILFFGLAGMFVGQILTRLDSAYKEKKAASDKMAEANAHQNDKARTRKAKRKARRKVEMEKRLRILEFGDTQPKLVCPHCQERGTVRTKTVKRKKGLSGGKATGAVITGGLSALVTGLSRKEDETQAHCDNCESTWHY